MHWLPQMDKIIVMVNGEMSEVGTYDELLSHDGPFAQFLKMYLQETVDDEEIETDSECKCI